MEQNEEDQTPPPPEEPIHPIRTPEEQIRDNDKYKTVGLLTQLIEPKSKKHIEPTTTVNTITNEFKQAFLNKITILDRARAHKDSLNTFLERGRILQKLQIKIQPLVVNRELPEFKLKWEQTLRNCEHKLMNLLIEHLETVIDKMKGDIRRDSNNCLEALKRTAMPEHKVKLKLDETLKAAVRIQTENQSEATKRKRERNQTETPEDTPVSKKTRKN